MVRLSIASVTGTLHTRSDILLFFFSFVYTHTRACDSILCTHARVVPRVEYRAAVSATIYELRMSRPAE